MYKLQINELTPGRKYYVKVRAKAPGYATSEWSPAFEFEAEQDQIPPERVRNLEFTSEGESFIAKWEAPELNMDGTPCTDLSHYNVTLINADASVTTTLQTSTPEFNIDFNRNTQLFGSPSHIIEITVTAVDRVGNEGPGTSKIAQNPPPNKVENVTAQSGVESVTVGWTLGTETDLAAYRIYVSDDASFTPSAATFRGEVASGTDSFAYNTSSFVTQYFRVVAVDKFGATSVPSDAASARPKLTTDYDKTPPGRVLDFTVTQSLASDNNSAVATVTYSSLADTDLDKYELQYRKTGDTVAPWSFASVPSDQTTAEIKPLPLSTDYDFRIRAVDFNANKGAWSAVVVAEGVKKTSLPGAPTDIVASGGATNLMVTWTESADESMASWAGTYEVQISKTSDFNSSITIKTASTLASFTGLEPNTIYYARARSIDPYGNVGPWSEVVDGNTGIVFDPNAPQIYWSDLPPEGGKENDLWIQLPQNIQHRFDGTEWVEAQDLNLIDKIDAVMQSSDSKNRNVYSEEDASGTTLGDYSFIDGDTWYKRDSANTILSMWEFRNGGWVIKTLNDTVISNLDAGKITSGYINAGRIDADTITGEMIASKTIVVGNMAEGSVDQTVIADGAIVTDKIAANAIVATKIDTDAVTADKIKFGEISGDHLAANTAIVNNLEVQSSVTINGVNGHIKSENYTANGTAGFYMDQQQLIINQGKISAAALHIQDSQNLLPPVFAGLNYRSEYYNNSIFSDNGGTFQHRPNAGRNADGAIFHVGRHTRLLLAPIDMTGYIAFTEGEKYIVSAYARARTIESSGTISPINVSLGVVAVNLYNEDSIEVNGSPKVVTDTFPLQRVQMVFTASFDGLGAIYLNQHDTENNGPLGPEDGVLWSGLQVERVVGGNEVASPWSPPGHTMIGGESITTGEISSFATIQTSNGPIAAWSINTAGDARFADATIDGKLIVGGRGSENDKTSVQSDSYVAGIEGWAIKGNGDVEFNDGTFRGILNLSSPGAGASAPTLTASVMPTDLYVTSEDTKTIHIAGIRGQVTGYTREEIDEGSGHYLPTNPDPNKRARYFIGPTTDRSLTIQVHDSSDIEDVAFLDASPDDVNLSLVNIGEITNPAEEPSGYLNQGFRHRSGAGNPDNYARVEQSSTATTGSSEDIRSSHVFSIDSRSSHHKRSSQTSLALNSNPAETNSSSMNLSVTEFYESGGAINSDSAEYVWTPKGMSYPGVETPFMPTAASIAWDWSSYAPGDRPSIGDAATLRTINTGNWGRINLGEGRSYLDLFNGPQEKPLRGAWISVGSPHAYKEGGRVRWGAGDYMGRTGPTNDFYLHSSPLGSFNHEVAAQVDRWGVIFGIGWAAEAVLVCSYDPVTKDGIFFRYKDQASMNPAAGIYVRRNGVVRAIWESNTRPAYDRYEHKLIRDGNTVRAFLNGNQVATITDNDLPTGEYFGFALEAGQMYEIRGKALVPGSDAKGMLLPTSVNVNNRRGITVHQSGAINIDAPGYYMISATLNSDKFGGHWNREYWMTIRHGGVRYEIGNNGSRYDGAGFRHMQGSLLAYMSGPIDLAIHSNAAEASRISKARLEIARLA